MSDGRIARGEGMLIGLMAGASLSGMAVAMARGEAIAAAAVLFIGLGFAFGFAAREAFE